VGTRSSTVPAGGADIPDGHPPPPKAAQGDSEITTIEAEAGSIAITTAPWQPAAPADQNTDAQLTANLTADLAGQSAAHLATGARPVCGMRLTSRANRALSLQARRWVSILMCLPVLVVSIGVAIQGAWLVLPFAGLEIALILFAFHWLGAGDDDFESVHIDADQVVVSRSDRGRTSEVSFNLHWVQVDFVPAGIARKSLLALRSHGRRYRLGHLMTEAERTAAAHYLSLHIRRARSAPA